MAELLEECPSCGSPTVEAYTSDRPTHIYNEVGSLMSVDAVCIACAHLYLQHPGERGGPATKHDLFMLRKNLAQMTNLILKAVANGGKVP